MKINIVKPSFPDILKIQDKFDACLRSGLVTNNSINVREFESHLGAFLKMQDQPLAFCNGEMALYSLIQAWKRKLGYSFHDSFKVLVPSFTFSGTVNAIVANNLFPVFCDIDESLTINLSKIQTLDENIKMIVPVGVYGNLVDIQKVNDFAEENNLITIFDNAPAFGSKYKGNFSSFYPINEIFSFHATKVFSTMEGGMAHSPETSITEDLIISREFGQYEKTRGDISLPGLNTKMQEINAIIGNENLKDFNLILENRMKIANQYNDFFQTIEKNGNLKRMKINDNVECTYLYYPIILNEEASNFVQHMNSQGIAVRRYYTAVHTLKYYMNKYDSFNLDLTNFIKDKIVSLPIHSDMSQEEINYLFKTIQHYFNN